MTAPFHVIAKPSSSKCNLDCSYCFYNERTKQDAGDMTLETLEAFTRQYIDAQPDAPEINFAWQGGEPTLRGLEFYRKAVKLQAKYAAPGQCVSNSFQTNGVLLNNEWATFFRTEGFLVGLSIDGIDRLHDASRKTRGGEGSFAQVIQAASLLRNHGVPYNTLTCVTRANQDHGAETYDWLRDVAKSTHMQFIPVVGPQSDDVDDSCTPEGYGQFMCDVFDAWTEADWGKVTIKYFEDQLAIHVGMTPGECTLRPTCGRALAIEADGSLYSCDHFVDAAHVLPHLQNGLTHSVESPVQRDFGQDKFTELPQKCRECAILKHCWGGCPKDRLPSGVNYLCDGFKKIYSHTQATLRSAAAALTLAETKR